MTLLGLTLLTLVIHGYHPFAEDGGNYAAGVEYALNPSLFPHDRAFAAAHRAYSIFDPLLAVAVRASHLNLEWLLLLANVCCIWLMLYATWRLACRCLRAPGTGAPAIFAAALMAASFTLPIAGTALYLMEPYLTARSFSTPLSLLALSFVLEALETTPLAAGVRRRSLAAAAGCLIAAAAMHPLMAVYAAVLAAACCLVNLKPSRLRWISWLSLAAVIVTAATTVQLTAAHETQPMQAAALSRSYFYLSRWQWYEWLGLPSPLIIFVILLQRARQSLSESGRALCRACVALGIISFCVALLFARQHASVHAVARLQPLRMFLLLYAVVIAIAGSALAAGRPEATSVSRGDRYTRHRVGLAALLLAAASGLFFAQRLLFPASRHLEPPSTTPSNPWGQAFLWARDNTPQNALFAMDARYISAPSEDAQVFRAVAQRSMLSDYSKDGGIAAVLPSLASSWQTGVTAQDKLSTLTDADRDHRIIPLGVTWMLLQSSAITNHACPYDNGTVKICRLA